MRILLNKQDHFYITVERGSFPSHSTGYFHSEALIRSDCTVSLANELANYISIYHSLQPFLVLRPTTNVIEQTLGRL